MQGFLNDAEGENQRTNAESGNPAWGTEKRKERCVKVDWQYEVEVWFVKDTTGHTKTKKDEKEGPETRCRIYKDGLDCSKAHKATDTDSYTEQN